MQWNIDKGLLLTVLFFIGLGVVQVYSSSFIYAIEYYNNGYYFFSKQLFFAVLGVLVLVSALYIPWTFWERWGFLLWFVAVGLLFATFVPGLGVKAGGASRWISLPWGFRFEPSELVKISFPLILATLMFRRPIKFGKYHVPISALLLVTVFYTLLKQPDFGSFAIVLSISFLCLFYFGLKWRYLFFGLLTLIPSFYFLIYQVPYRWARVQAFIDPWADPTEKGFQVIQSLLSFGSGGLSGVGLGAGQGKLFFLPEAHTDFTLAVLGEELGFIGFLFVFILYGFLIYRGLQITLKAKSEYAQAVAIGLTSFFALSVFINMGVVLGVLPTKGLTLPFLSYGGSSLVTSCLACGLLLSIDRHSRRIDERRRFKGFEV